MCYGIVIGKFLGADKDSSSARDNSVGASFSRISTSGDSDARSEAFTRFYIRDDRKEEE